MQKLVYVCWESISGLALMWDGDLCFGFGLAPYAGLRYELGFIPCN